jgi:hypothetical protein
MILELFRNENGHFLTTGPAQYGSQRGTLETKVDVGSSQYGSQRGTSDYIILRTHRLHEICKSKTHQHTTEQKRYIYACIFLSRLSVTDEYVQ